MPTEYRMGNLFDYKGNLAHGTNMQGVMGKGIAVEFKRRFPQMFAAYKETCEAGRHLPGMVFSHKEISIQTNLYNLMPPSSLLKDNELLTVELKYDIVDYYIYNLCVKSHWRLKSEAHVVRACVKNMVEHMEANNQKEVAMPTIGCGLGGLNWERQVKPFVEEIGNSTSCNLIVYLQE